MTGPEKKTPENNRFEQVDERQEDAITLFLLKTPDGPRGFLTCPAAISQGRSPADQISEQTVPQDAFRAAIRLANDLKAPLVVADPEGLWNAEWGVLFRED